ncbi:MAG: GAF domain-containing protein [Anaerolineales bacterium]
MKETSLEEYKQLVEEQARALLDVVQYVALGDLDVAVAVPEGIEVISELAVGIEMMIDDLQDMLTRQERAKTTVEAVLAQAEALYAGSNRVIRARNVEEVLQALIHSTALQRFGRINILLFDRPFLPDERPDAFTVAAVWERSDEMSHEILGTRYDFDRFPTTRFLTRQEPLIIPDVATDERLDENTRKLILKYGGMRSIVFWSLVAGEQWLGAVSGQSSTTVLQMNENEQRQISSLVGQAAVVIQNIRLYEQTQAALAEAEATHRLYLRQRWQDYLSQYDRLTYEVAPAIQQPGVETITPGDAFSASNGGGEELPALAIPITIRGQSIGVLGVEAPDGAGKLSDEQQALVEAVGQQLGLALENARLLENTQRRAAREQLTSAVTTRIRETLDIETILKTASEEFRQAFDVPEVIVRLGAPASSGT